MPAQVPRRSAARWGWRTRSTPSRTCWASSSSKANRGRDGWSFSLRRTPLQPAEDRFRRPRCHATRIVEPFTLRRRGIETKIIAGETMPAPDPGPQRSLAEAHVWARSLRAGTQQRWHPGLAGNLSTQGVRLALRVVFRDSAIVGANWNLERHESAAGPGRQPVRPGPSHLERMIRGHRPKADQC